MDTGSQVNLITDQLSKKLKTKCTPSPLTIAGVGEASKSAQTQTNLQIASRVTTFNTMIEVFVVDKIIDHQPQHDIAIPLDKVPETIQLADPLFHKQQGIEMIIGAEWTGKVFTAGQLSTDNNLPLFQNTVFGWVASGKTTSVEPVKELPQFCNTCTVDRDTQGRWAINEIKPHQLIKNCLNILL